MKKPLLFTLIFIFSLLSSCIAKVDRINRFTINLGNFFSISPYVIIECNESFYNTYREDIYNSLREILSDLDNKFNVHNNYSLISRLNESSGIKSIVCDDEFIYVLEKAIEISNLTSINGISMYDISIYSIFELWDFETNYYIYNNFSKIPSIEKINEKLSLVSYKDIIINGNEVFLRKKGAKIDLGSIAKGYASNKLFLKLKDYGLNSGLIDVGGNIVSFGLKHLENEISNYRIGIKTPFVSEIRNDYNIDEQKDINIIAYVDAKEEMESFVTSGVYERYIVSEEKKMYHHILSPIDGFPIDNGIVSITVFSNSDSTILDALSTALFGMGIEKALEFSNRFDLNCVIISKDRLIYLSEKAKERVIFNELLRKSGYYVYG